MKRERERGEREGKGCNKRNYQSCKHPFDEDECGTCRNNPLPFSQEIFEEKEKKRRGRFTRKRKQEQRILSSITFCKRLLS